MSFIDCLESCIGLVTRTFTTGAIVGAALPLCRLLLGSWPA
jgi:hypothetical protein